MLFRQSFVVGSVSAPEDLTGDDDTLSAPAQTLERVPHRLPSSTYRLSDLTGAVSLNSPSEQTAPQSSSHSPGPSSLPTLGKHPLGRLRYSRVKSTPPSHPGWVEERTRT